MSDTFVGVDVAKQSRGGLSTRRTDMDGDE